VIEEITMKIRGNVGTYRVFMKEDGTPGPVYRKCYSPKTGRHYETQVVGHGATAHLVREAVMRRLAA
jgi:hypothetical protein